MSRKNCPEVQSPSQSPAVTPPVETVETEVAKDVANPPLRRKTVETWDPMHLTLDQIASVKYWPLGGKG